MFNAQSRSEGDSKATRDSGQGAEHESLAMRLSHEAMDAFHAHSFDIGKTEHNFNQDVKHMLHGFSVHDGNAEHKSENAAEHSGEQHTATAGDQAQQPHDKSEQAKDDTDGDKSGTHKSEKDGKSAGDSNKSKHQQSGEQEPPPEDEEEKLRKRHQGIEVPTPVESTSMSDMQQQKDMLQAMDMSDDGVRSAMATVNAMMSMLHGLEEGFASQDDPSPPDTADGYGDSTGDDSPGQADAAPQESPLTYDDQGEEQRQSSDEASQDVFPDWMRRLSNYENGEFRV
jgi:hypothetical protein